MRQVTRPSLACVAAIAASIVLVPCALAYDQSAETGSVEPTLAASMFEMTDVISNCTLTGGKIAALDSWVIAEPIPTVRISLMSDETIIGMASFYDEPQPTASGEQFDPDGFTAAAQLEIRHKFGGIRFGRKYQPAYAVAEYDSKKIILKFNDVGPLRPGRKFDLSRAAMAYFGGLEKGLLPDVKVTPLPLGEIFTSGPVTDEQLAAMGIGNIDLEFPTLHAAVAPEPGVAEPAVTLALSTGPAVDAVDPSVRETAVAALAGEEHSSR